MEKNELNKIIEEHKLWLQTRYSGNVQGKRANLKGANLEDANLRDANLVHANLVRASLEGANLEDASLKGANLRDASLEGANLRDANLVRANLKDASLEGANLRDANLVHANLKDANLKGANLKGANLRDAKNIPQSLMDYFKKDLRYVLLYTKNEIQFLKEKLLQGQVNGTQYKGGCACLIGSLANGKHAKYEEYIHCVPYYTLGLHNPSEQLFFQIREEDTPENNQFAKIAIEVIAEVEKEIKNAS